MRRLLLRSFAIAFVAFALFFGAELAIEWYRAGGPPWGAATWKDVNNAKLVDLLSPIARAYNNVLAMLLATIGLAIPLTANMHTPKLIEMFLRDRVNRWVLSFMAFGAAHTLWVDYMIGPKFAPTWALTVVVFLALASWAILIPYFFYVVRFVDPSRLVQRLRDDAMDIIKSVADRKTDALDAQTVISTRITQLGTIMIKSLDRDDRDVAAEAVWAIKVVLDNYGGTKARMPREWFVVDRADFVGLSDEALEMLNESKTWFEMKCLLQVEHGFLRSCRGSSDSVSVFSDALRVIATRFEVQKDLEALRLAIRFFNNYLREAIKAKNIRAVYDTFHQYRRLARDLLGHPPLLREIGEHFCYYANMARTYGMVFAPQLAIFDLGYITRRAYEKDCTVAPALLGDVLSLPHRTNDDFHTYAVKAKLILGGFFIQTKHEPEAALVRLNLHDVSKQEIESCEAALLDADPSFWEVTDRQLNVEYVPPERREPLKAFCASLLAR
ncbi:MAG TPA: DUF2254 family protein [Kofleriaceae bacterium]